MVSVTISHVIGTVALIGLFITAGMSYQIHFANLSEEAGVAQLQSITDYVSTAIMDIYSIGSSVEGDQHLVKTLEIPGQVAQSSYNVSLIRVTTISGEQTFSVLARLTWKPTIYAESELPFNGMDGLRLYNGTLPLGFHATSVQPRTFVLSGASTVVVWYDRAVSSVTLGLGVRS
jgi:hypothetical protein